MAENVFCIEPAGTFNILPIIIGQAIGTVWNRCVEIIHTVRVIPLDEAGLIEFMEIENR